MFNEIHTICLVIFTLLYKVIHTHLTSYILIALLCGLVLKSLWKYLQNQKKMTNIISKIITLFIIGCCLTFTIWFICFHFHTFRIIES